ncbi:MAG: divalent cation tolerance protein CutA, partial [Pseudonocardiaceae bacterium]
EVQTEQESRLEIKTTVDRVTAPTAHIKDNHSYDLPEIIAIPIAGGSAEYLSWLIAGRATEPMTATQRSCMTQAFRA